MRFFWVHRPSSLRTVHVYRGLQKAQPSNSVHERRREAQASLCNVMNNYANEESVKGWNPVQHGSLYLVAPDLVLHNFNLSSLISPSHFHSQLFCLASFYLREREIEIGRGGGEESVCVCVNS